MTVTIPSWTVWLLPALIGALIVWRGVRYRGGDYDFTGGFLAWAGIVGTVCVYAGMLIGRCAA